MNPTHAEFTTSNLYPCEDLKVRLRHHSLMQDYQELHMDTVAMRKRLKTMRERKATLMAEVRFLRRRYRHLRQRDQPVKQPPGVKKGEEEEETEAGNNSEERMRVEDSKRISIIEMQQQKEMKLSSCRDGENGSNKRKISWQDPVAPLRV
ncbi:hypothetical protein HID58_009160 [Brassica napus]|uniref:Uncharacterized protein n=1 Tax=Brassica napus TaxID=3708 RepID=A0ABQ8DS09_BRANA|nr:hypothetical protein HID58_009143 [Brassica napus]KAH0932043.1 hypothetical protein HID58_009160 [Brassica napus]